MYFNIVWFFVSGVQCGLLFIMFGNGDFQIFGIVVFVGMFWRLFNDSELFFIFVYFMGYGDVIYFFKRIKGNICF